MWKIIVFIHFQKLYFIFQTFYRILNGLDWNGIRSRNFSERSNKSHVGVIRGHSYLLLRRLPFSDETDWIFCLIIICCIGTFSSGKYAWHPLSSLITSSAFKTEWQTLGARWNLNEDFDVSYRGFRRFLDSLLSHYYESSSMSHTVWLSEIKNLCLYFCFPWYHFGTDEFCPNVGFFWNTDQGSDYKLEIFIRMTFNDLSWTWVTNQYWVAWNPCFLPFHKFLAFHLRFHFWNFARQELVVTEFSQLSVLYLNLMKTGQKWTIFLKVDVILSHLM